MCICSILLIGSVFQGLPPKGAVEFKGKKVEVMEAPLGQTPGRNPLRILGAEIPVGNSAFAVATDGKLIRVATSLGKSPSTSLTNDKVVRFDWREGEIKRQAELRFVQGSDGLWAYFNSEAKRFDIKGVSFELIDCDANGVYGDFEHDGYRAYGSTCVSPLKRELVLGASQVEFESIASDGSVLTARISAIPGTPQQLAALVRINQLRSAHGLTPVILDERLSAGATSHAHYLEANQWTGFTNPHDQTLGPEGKSDAGRAAAQRSAIIKEPPLEAISGFWSTYYHRIGFMSQSLSHVGINGSPSGLAVIDTASGLERNIKLWPSDDPVFVPANGSVGVPVNSGSELPTEPVSQLDSRGFCLMVSFPPNQTGVTEFSGMLEELVKGKAVETKTLPANQDSWKWVFGIVPEAPLRSGAKYRATYRYTKAGKPFVHTVVFQTE